MGLPTSLQQIAADGAAAYCAGRPYIANPYYTSENCPGATGEPLAEWSRKVGAWEDGWGAEAALHAPDGTRKGARGLPRNSATPPQ
jgi:hypothetical protein